MQTSRALAAYPRAGGGRAAGHLIATCASPLSRNYHVGYELGKGARWTRSGARCPRSPKG